MSVRECPTVCPITINNTGNVALTQLVKGSSSVAVGTVCLSQLNSDIEILLNGTSDVTPLACIETLVNFQDLLNFGENTAQAFIVYAGDINLNAAISLSKDLVIMSTGGNVTINQALTATNIYVFAPKGTITLGSQANLSVGTGTIMLSAQGGISYSNSTITADTLVLSHDIDVGTSVQNKVVNTGVTLLEDMACGNGTNVVTLTYAQIVEGGNFGNVTVVSGTNSTITITVADDVDLELTADDMTDDLVLSQSITIITPGSVCLPQGLVTTGGNGLNISITAGRHIIAQDSGINSVNSISQGNSGTIALNAGGSIIVSGVGTNPTEYSYTLSGINSLSQYNSSSVSVVAGGTIALSSGDVSISSSATGINSLGGNSSSSVSVIAGDAIIVNSGAVGQNSATGINSQSGVNSGSVSVIAGNSITVNSGSGEGSIGTGINSFGFNSSSDVSVIAGDSITVNSGSGTRTYSATGINSWSADGGVSASVSVIAGDTITLSSGSGANANATGINSWSLTNSGSVSVIALYDITITSGSNSGSPSVSGVNSHGGRGSNSILISACDTISFNNLGTTDSIRTTGTDVILIGNTITKDDVTLGTNLSTLTTSTVSRLAQTPCSGTSFLSTSPSISASVSPSVSPSILPLQSAFLICPLPLDALCELLNLLKSLTSNSIVILHYPDEKIADIHVNDGTLYTYSDNQKTPFDVDSCLDYFVLGTGTCASVITIFESYQQKNDFVRALDSYYSNVVSVINEVDDRPASSMIAISNSGTGLFVDTVDLPILQFITLQDRIVVEQSPTQASFYTYPVSDNVVTLTAINTINTPAPITNLGVVDQNIQVLAGGIVYTYDTNGNLILPCSPTKNKRVRKNNTFCNPSARSRK